MKCKKCGATARDIDGMRRHYLKKHPGAMKHKGPRVRYEGGKASYDRAIKKRSRLLDIAEEIRELVL